MREDHGFNPILTPVSTTLENRPNPSTWGILCRHMLHSRLLLSLKQRGCNAIWVSPPSPLADFFSSPCSDFGTVPPEVCAAVILRGKASFQGSSTPCPCSGSSLQPTSPSHLPCPVSVTGSPEDFPGQLPARVSGQQGETQPGSAHGTSCTAPRGQMHRAGCAGAGPQPD